MKIPLPHISIAAAILLLTSSTGAQSEEIIEEIVVMSEFRNPSIDDAPMSVTVISLNDARRTVVNHLEEVLSWAPNVNYASGASRGRFIQIRGIGERSQFVEPLNSSVGLVLDGVDLSGVGGAATLYDVRQVEVVRGPQGTLYGANALAGLINVVTNDPTETFTGRLNLDAGDYGSAGVGGVISGPLGETVGYRVSVRHYQDDGFISNRYLGADDTNKHDELSLRAKLEWSPNEIVQTMLTLGRADINNGYDAFSLDKNRNTFSDQPGVDEQQTDYASFRAVVAVSTAMNLEASIGHASSDIDYGYDEDWSYVGFDPWEYSSTDRYQRERDTTSGEIRLVSSPGGGFGGGRVDWVAGLYGLNQEVDLQRTYTFFPDDLVSRYKHDRIAVYGELTGHLNDRMRLTFGLRAERHESEYADSLGVRFSPDDSMTGGRVLFEMDLAHDTLLYAGVTRGYKAGGFNTDGTLDADLRLFDPETLWNYEVGLKGTYIDNALSLRVAVFYMQREDIQISTSVTRQRPDGSSEFIAYTGNAAEGANQGVELELTWNATDALTLFANAGLLDTKFDSYVNGEGEDLSGRDQAHAPAYQFFAGAQYNFGERLYARVEVEGKDRFYYSDSHQFQSQAFELINLVIGYEAPNWHVRLWGRNLTDEQYGVRGFYFPNDPRKLFPFEGWTQLGDPRRVGLSIGLSL
ncbi:MAG: TonB-dependent receptor [Proteobacteria bacterium]|nr:TonB-dependent receptor [Pseudomonadota bacterium]